MRKITVLAISILMLGVMGQYYGAGNLGVTSIGGVGSFCDGAPTNLFCEDFEEPYDDCAEAARTNTADSETNDPHCAYRVNPLSGEQSGRMDTSVHSAGVRPIFTTDVVDCTSGTCVAHFLWLVESGAGGAISVFEMRTQASLFAVGFYYSGTGDTVHCQGTTGGAGSTIAVADDTQYYVCLEYDVTADTAVLKMSASSHCGTDVGSETCLDGATDRSDVGQFRLGAVSGTRGDHKFDDMYLTQE